MTGSLLAAAAALVVLGPAEPIELAPGESAVARLRLRVEEGFKVQANPAATPDLVPLTLTLDSAERVEVGEPGYPPPGRHELRGSSLVLLTYEGEIELSVPLAAAADADAGERHLTGTLEYQACNDHVCLRPETASVDLPVVIR